MAHSHAHAHSQEAASEYFRDQLCTIAACGFLGAIGVLMYATPMQKIILAPAFERPVLIGGIALLAVVLVRAVSVWKVAGTVQEPEPVHDHSHSDSHSHSHSHSHGEDEKCDHPSHQACEVDHGEEGHDDHDHGSAPWRYVILLIPIALYFLDLPNSGFSDKNLAGVFGKDKIEVTKRADPTAAAALVSNLVQVQRFLVARPIGSMNELNMMTLSPRTRDAMEGARVSLKGMYLISSSHDFDLFKLKRVCCGADAVPIRARVVCQKPLGKIEPRSWLQVTGELHFVKTQKGEWVSVIVVDDPEEGIVPAEKDVEFEDA